MTNIGVADFYAGKSVFVTGGTGFLGKVLIEKILRSCPDVKNIYVLIREKRNCNVQQRLETLSESPLFERIKCKNRQQFTKIVPIAGDIVLPKLGITEEDAKILREQVSIVIHAAATVKFNEPLNIALNINYEGTKKVLELCRKMKNIQAFVHVSTAFAHTKDKIVEEKVYPTPADVDQLFNKLEDYEEVDDLQLIDGWPNTYAFTKALAETFVAENHGDIPTVIVRPSIVTPSASEPIPGWIDNWFGATGYLTSIGMGSCRVMYSHRENIVDFIPADYVANTIIVAAAKTHDFKGIKILNCCTGGINPITTGQATVMYTENMVRVKANKMIFPKVLLTRNKWLAWIVILFAEIIPAFLADCVSIFTIKSNSYMKKQKLVAKLRDSLEYFTSHSWIMQSNNVQRMVDSLSPQEALQFPCDVRDICWPKYMTTYVNGVKKFLLCKLNK